jgi:hypothetical protein
VQRMKPPGGAEEGAAGGSTAVMEGRIVPPERIRPARAPKGPGRPFSSERGRPGRSTQGDEPPSGDSPERREAGRRKRPTGSPEGSRRRIRVEATPEGEDPTSDSAVALLLLGDLLGSLLLLLGHGNGSLPRAPSTVLTSIPPDALGGERTTFRHGVSGDHSPSTPYRCQSCG